MCLDETKRQNCEDKISSFMNALRNYIWISQEVVQAVVQDHRCRDLLHRIFRRHESPVEHEVLQYAVVVGPKVSCKRRI